MVKGVNYRAIFLDFQVLESKFVKFLIAVLKRQVNSSSNFALFLIVMTHNSCGNFKVLPFLLWTKGSHQNPNFNTFKCSGKNLENLSCLFSNHKSVFPQNLHKFSVSWKITPLTFVAQTIYTFVTRSQLKHKFFRISSAQIKICEVPHVNFKTSSVPL